MTFDDVLSVFPACRKLRDYSQVVDIFTERSVLVAWKEFVLILSSVQKAKEVNYQAALFSLCLSIWWLLVIFIKPLMDREGQPCLFMPLMAWFPKIRSHESSTQRPFIQKDENTLILNGSSSCFVTCPTALCFWSCPAIRASWPTWLWRKGPAWTSSSAPACWEIWVWPGGGLLFFSRRSLLPALGSPETQHSACIFVFVLVAVSGGKACHQGSHRKWKLPVTWGKKRTSLTLWVQKELKQGSIPNTPTDKTSNSHLLTEM